MQVKKNIIIFLSLVISLLLDVLPLPYRIELFNPDWLALVVIYWLIAMPQSLSLGVIWFMGIILDLLHGNILGEHSFGLILMAYLVVKLRRLLRIYSWWQGAVLVLALILVKQGILAVVQAILGWRDNTSLLYSAVTSALVWPLLCLLLKNIRGKIQPD